MCNRDLVAHWVQHRSLRHYGNLRCYHDTLFSYHTVIGRRIYPTADFSFKAIILVNQTYYSRSTHRHLELLQHFTAGRMVCYLWEQPMDTRLDFNVISLDQWYRIRVRQLQRQYRDSQLTFREGESLLFDLARTMDQARRLRGWLGWPNSPDLDWQEDLLHVSAPDPQLSL
jgi:hypothetical protein